MEKKDNVLPKVQGAEALILHNGNIVLGMQKPKRWYNLENGKKATIIKTIGGKIEKEDEDSSKKALVRELFEEIKGMKQKDIEVSTDPIFTKQIKMGDLNPFEKNSELSMSADFYMIKILDKKEIKPNDLPALVEISIKEFLRLEFATQENLSKLKKYIIKNENYKFSLPDQYTLMIPQEIKVFLNKIKAHQEDVKR